MQTILVIQTLEVLLDFSGILRAAGVDELLSGSIEGGNPRSVGVDTRLHTLEREEVEGRRRWGEGDEEGEEGEKMWKGRGNHKKKLKPFSQP